MKILRLFLFAVMALVSVNAFARMSVPIVNLEGPVVLSAAGKAPTIEQVREAIVQAAAVHEWGLQETAPGVFLATLNVRDKHTVVTEIRYSLEKYSLTFVQSKNMNQKLDKDGKTMLIHPYYNKWTQTLNDDIRTALMRL